MLDVYIGWDPNETEAYEVAEGTCAARSSKPVNVKPLKARELYDRRLLWRPIERQGKQQYDHLSGAPQSTEFASSRFLVPFMQKTGWCLFVDCDMVFLGDVAELFEMANPKSAVMVVKHEHRPIETDKMMGLKQTHYSRKNWSSVILWNCDHPANQRLNIGMVNWWRGIQLHNFCWLADDEIGELPPEWNWLVGVEPKPREPKLAHFTLGGPWFAGWQPKEHDEIYHQALREVRGAP